MASMRTIDGILSGFTLLALASCVRSSPLYVGSTPPTRRAPASALEPMADSDSARLERTGFFQRQSFGWDAYFITPAQIAEIAPRTISDIFRRVPVLLENPFRMG